MEPEKNSDLSLYKPPSGEIVETKKHLPQYHRYAYDTELYRVQKNEPSKQDNIWQIISRRWFLIFGATATVTTSVYLWTLHQIPIYEGNFQLLVEAITFVNAESSMMEEAAELNEGKSDLIRQLERFLSASSQEKVVSQNGDGSSTSENSVSENNRVDYQSLIQVLKSPQIMEPIIEEIQTKYPEINYNYFLSGEIVNPIFNSDKLLIKRLDETKIIEVKYRDSEPNRILFVLEKIAAGYNKYNREYRKTNIGEAIKYIEKNLPAVQKRLAILQEKMQKLREDYQLIDPEFEGKKIAQEMSQIQTQKLENEILIQQQRSLSDILQSQLGMNPEEALMASAISRSPRYQSLLNQLQETETKIAIESARFKETAPQIQALVNQRQRLLPLLNQEAEKAIGKDLEKVNPQALAYQDEIRLELIHKMVVATNQIEVLQVRQKVLDRAEANLIEYTKKFPVILRQYTDIQRELQLNTNLVENLLAKRNSLQLQAAQEELPWELIAPPALLQNSAEELVSVSPNLILNLALGGVLGFLLGIGLAKLAEKLEADVFQTPKEVKNTVGLPLLGIVPLHDRPLWMNQELQEKMSSSLVLYPSAFHEAFRTVNANIRLLNFKNPIHSFVISSATPGDGKSTVSANLARAAAAVGQKVLLIDADLRCPQIHAMMGLDNDRGLSSVVMEGVLAEQAIQRSPADENLFVLTAGPIPTDPMKIFSSPKLEQLIQESATAFDLVICDTAPLLGRADASLLAAYTDGLMLVVGLGKTEREALKWALEDLSMAGVSVLGAIGNGYRGDSFYERYYTYDYVGNA